MSFFLREPYPHQIDAVKKFQNVGNLALLWEMGTGKTFGIINILRLLYGQHKRLMPTLIVSPLVTLINWKEEFLIGSKIDKNDIYVISGPKDKKIKAIRKAYDRKLKGEGVILITNYETIVNDEVFEALELFSPEVMVLDEAHAIKAWKSKRTKRCIKMSRYVDHRFISTGTLILNSPLDLFYPIQFLDRGETFGRNFDVFKSIYMYDENAAWSGKANHFASLVARPEAYEELHSKLQKRCMRVRTVDVLKDLPPYTVVNLVLPMSKEQERHYKEMERDFLTFIEVSKDQHEAVVASTAMVKALRFMQICAGHVKTDEGNVIRIKDSPKVAALNDLLEELVIGQKDKVIVWCSFKADYEVAEYVCNKLKIKSDKLIGGMSLENKQLSMDNFNKGDTDVIIANRKAGGIGVNLIAAKYSIVLSRNFSLEEELQSIARNYRGGSQCHDKIIRYELIIDGSIEQKVIEALQGKKQVADSIIDMVKENKAAR